MQARIFLISSAVALLFAAPGVYAHKNETYPVPSTGGDVEVAVPLVLSAADAIKIDTNEYDKYLECESTCFK